MKRLILLQGLLLLLMSAKAQKMVIDKVQKAPARNIAVIKEGTDVKGYYFFFISDKIDKRTNEYTLRIMDNGLNILKDIKFTDSKDIAILESSFNGTDLIFLFYNEKERTFDYQIYGADGKKKYTYNRTLSKREQKYLDKTYLSNMGDEEKTYKGLYPIEGKGFISNMPDVEGNDWTFQIDFFSTEKRKQWSYKPTVGGNKFMGDYLGTYNNIVLVEVLKFPLSSNNKADSYLVGLDLQTGKQLFEKLTDGKSRFYPTSISILNTGTPYVFGEYYNLGDNILKDKSQGFGIWEIDEKGKIISEKYNSWENDMSKYLKVNSKGKIDDFGYMYVHNIIQTSTGDIYAIGEGFKKVGGGLSAVATVMNSGSGVVAVEVTDMILIKFDKDFNIKDAKIYEKKTSMYSIYTQGIPSIPRLGREVKFFWGGFDYEYMQNSKDFSSFTVCYSDYVKGKGYKGMTFNAISYNDDKFTTDKINTKSDASSTIVLQGPQGQVLLVDYYKKEKKLEAHFEKLN